MKQDYQIEMEVDKDTPVCTTRKTYEQDMREFMWVLLTSEACPRYTMNMDQLDGYLHAIAAEPEPVTPDEWLPLVFGGEFPCFISGYSTEAITNALICLYNSHRSQVLNNQCTLPFICEFSVDKEKRISAEQWARGFMQGYLFWEPVWSRIFAENQTRSNLAVILPTSSHDELDDILAALTAVADADYALHTGATLDDLRRMFNQFPQRIIEYGRIAHMIRGSSHTQACERVEP